ncbi:hypothetical protein ACH6CV_14350 [Bacillota bacterium Meth-B3]
MFHHPSYPDLARRDRPTRWTQKHFYLAGGSPYSGGSIDRCHSITEPDAVAIGNFEADTNSSDCQGRDHHAFIRAHYCAAAYAQPVVKAYTYPNTASDAYASSYADI